MKVGAGAGMGSSAIAHNGAIAHEGAIAGAGWGRLPVLVRAQGLLRISVRLHAWVRAQVQLRVLEGMWCECKYGCESACDCRCRCCFGVLL